LAPDNFCKIRRKVFSNGSFLRRFLSLKRIAVILVSVVLALAAVQGATAQTKLPIPAPSQSLKAMGLNGATGLFAIPSGRIGWEHVADIGVDIGTAYNFVKEDAFAKLGMSLFKWVEISAATDFQRYVSGFADRNVYNEILNNTDTILGVKVQLPTKRTAVALGGNVQMINHVDYRTAGQIYLAATYPGSFFGMPAETSFALGYTFRKEYTSNIDFGMGFDLDLAPDIFQHFVHWVTEFSNFSYSDEPLGAEPFFRGCLNTGLRIDLSTIPVLSKFKLSVDLIATDLFDEGARSFVMGLIFGIPVMGGN
jgi:opacity protein-like surface antigen